MAQDYFEIDARVDDLILALARTLLDPGLGRDTKTEEVARVCERIRRLENQRAVAAHLSVLADALAPEDAA